MAFSSCYLKRGDLVTLVEGQINKWPTSSKGKFKRHKTNMEDMKWALINCKFTTSLPLPSPTLVPGVTQTHVAIPFRILKLMWLRLLRPPPVSVVQHIQLCLIKIFIPRTSCPVFRPWKQAWWSSRWSSILNFSTNVFLQLIAVPKAQIRNLLFWAVFKEFLVSHWVLHRFTWNLDRNTQLICAQLVIERNFFKYHIFGDLAWRDRFCG
jgi:hypothetical protein